ncbi:MAG: hypothetical protein QOJ59_4380, partial [Thermomicrobiales bacterium]|nr:hypothetical protein [Thermomicrobiales bacterium]
GGRSISPLGASKRTVYRLAALFSLDSLGGGFVVQSLLALWLFQRFDLSVATTGTIFFWSGLFSAFSQLAAPRLAARIGLVQTMVFTHLPANLFLIATPFMPTLPLAIATLLARSLVSSMDVPARTSYVMAVVSPEERPAAASVTNVPRSLASALGPFPAGYLLGLSTFGWPLVIGGTLKAVYDLLLLAMFHKLKPPEERDGETERRRDGQAERLVRWIGCRGRSGFGLTRTVRRSRTPWRREPRESSTAARSQPTPYPAPTRTSAGRLTRGPRRSRRRPRGGRSDRATTR